MKRRFTRLGGLGLAVVAVLAITASPAAAKTKTAEFNQCVSGNVPIADFSSSAVAPASGLSVPVTVPNFKGKAQDGVVTSFASVDVRITHTYSGDLHLILVSPGGKAILLASERGGDGDGYGSGSPSCLGTPVLFTDTAATPIATPGNVSPAPIVGTFRPEQPLSTFVGGPARGPWTLVVIDDASTDSGSINGLSLHFTYQYKVKPKKKKK